MRSPRSLRGAAVALSMLSASAWLWHAPEPDAPPAGGGSAAVAAQDAPAVRGGLAQGGLPAELDLARSQWVDPAPAPVAGPRVRTVDRRFDWGEVPANQSFGHVFVLHNDGDAVLHIQKLRPS